MKKLEFRSVLREPGEYDCYINDGINNIFIERYDLNSLNDYRDFIIVCENEFDYIDEEDKSNINKCKEYICDKYYISKKQNTKTKKIEDVEEKRKLFKWATDYYNRMGYRLSLKKEYPGDEPKYIDQNSKKEHDFKYSDYLVITGTDNIKKELSFRNIQKLYKDSIDAISETSFEKQVDMLVDYIKYGGRWEDYKDDKLYICDMPKILKDIGFKGDKLTLDIRKFHTIFGKIKGHINEFSDPITGEIDYNIIKQLPAKLNDPLVILHSNTRVDSVVMVIDLDNKFGYKLIVPISLQKGSTEITFDDVTLIDSVGISTIYGGSNKANLKSKIEISRAIKNKKIIHVSSNPANKRTIKQLNSNLLNIPQGDLFDFNAIASSYFK